MATTAILNQRIGSAQPKPTLRQRAAIAYQQRLASERLDEARTLVLALAEVLDEEFCEAEVEWCAMPTRDVIPVVSVGLDRFTARWNADRCQGDLFYLARCPRCTKVYEIKIDHLDEFGAALDADKRCASCVEKDRVAEAEESAW